MSAHGATGSILKQPRAVWAVAFACVIAFMGIGLVDPILPAIASSLDATPTESELLFTSYLAVTGVVMFFSSWVSSRIGAKRTLLIGLALVVIFAALAGLSGSIDAVIGFRAGWGLGNALFISTALATIVGAASGGTGSAIILYEAALGLGIAIGPLVGGALGSVSWRGPFFGTASLMAVGFVAVVVLLPGRGSGRADARGGAAAPAGAQPASAPIPLSAPFRALAVPALGVLAGGAFFYNIAFFILLAYSPFVLPFSEIGLGLVFFGWGLGVALTSVLVAPALTRRFRRTIVIRGALVVLALVLVAAGLLAAIPAGVVVAVIVGGLALGVLNTALTESVMEATDLPRPVASGAYSGVRFLGGAIAPPLATLLADAFGPGMPYWVAAASVAVTIAILALGARALRRVDGRDPSPVEEAAAVGTGDA
jgi:MFS family permease